LKKVAAIGLLAILSAGAAYLIFAWAIVPHRCNGEITLLTVRTESADAAVGYRRLASAKANIEELQRLTTRCGGNVRVPLLIGANHEIRGAHESAVASYREALLLDQRPELYSALGAIQIQLGQLEEATKTYTTLARFAPETVETIPSQEVKRRVTEILGR
jgi:tetratricopeptide (TPR) repeat protein